MKRPSLIFISIAFLTLSASAQLTNDTIQSRIKAARAEKSITLSFDAAGKTSKLMAVSGNFSDSEAGRSGLMAMNFAIGTIYPGDILTMSPDYFQLSFWVMAKKPRFGSNHAMTVVLREEMLVVGTARYASRPREQMEYLNFEVSRENLTKIAGQTDVRFMLGNEEFTFTSSQMRLLADMLAVTELGIKN